MSAMRGSWRVAFTGGGDAGARRRHVATQVSEAIGAAGVLDVLDAFSVEEGAEMVARLEVDHDDEGKWQVPESEACTLARTRASSAGLAAGSGRAGVIVALDPPAAAAFVSARGALDGPRASVIGLVPTLAVHPAWAVADADLYAVAHQDLARSLRNLGLPPARVQATGIPISAGPLASAGAAKRQLGLMEEARVILCMGGEIGEELLDRLLLQLSLISGECWFLFGSGGEPRIANLLREKTPIYGLHAKLFGDVESMQPFLRAADIVVGEATGWRAVSCLAAGAYLVGLTDDAPGAEAEHVLTFLARHRAGARAANVLQLATEVDLAYMTGTDIVRERVQALAPADPILQVRRLCEELLELGERTWQRAQPEATTGPAATATAASAAAPSGGEAASERRVDAGPRDGLLEDLETGEVTGHPTEPVPLSPAEEPADAEASADASNPSDAPRLAQLREARATEARWKRRLGLATSSGELSLAAEARKRLHRVRRQIAAFLRPAAPARPRGSGGSAEPEPTGEASQPGEARDEGAAAQPVPEDREEADGRRSEETRPTLGLEDDRAAELRERFSDLEAEAELERLRDRVREGGEDLPARPASGDDVRADGADEELTEAERAARREAIDNDLQNLRDRLQREELSERGGSGSE